MDARSKWTMQEITNDSVSRRVDIQEASSASFPQKSTVTCSPRRLLRRANPFRLLSHPERPRNLPTTSLTPPTLQLSYIKRLVLNTHLHGLANSLPWKQDSSVITAGDAAWISLFRVPPHFEHGLSDLRVADCEVRFVVRLSKFTAKVAKTRDSKRKYS